MSVVRSRDGGIARLTLSRPPLNILTRVELGEIRRAVAELAEEPALRVLLLDAAGRHFSAGADVGEHLPPAGRALIQEFTDTIAALDTFPLPVIAAVQGRCLGGGFELVQAADLVIAAEGATFGQPEILLGVIPPAACALLAKKSSAAFAASVILTGDPVPAAEAWRAGFLARVVPDAELETAATALAQRLAGHSAAALRLAKRTMRAGSLGEAGRLYVEQLMATRDAEEGLRAFLEKRRPVWSNA